MIRNEVKWFAGHMVSKLQENEYKTGWTDCTVDFLSSQIQKNLNELNSMFQELPSNYSVFSANVIRQCSDIANYAMMIADISYKYICKYDPPNKGDVEYENHLTCPYCGGKNYDAFELSEDNDTINCGKCGSEIEYSREVEVTYSTRPVKRNNPIKL
ncbi:hypothetical protein [Bacillus arachidis]|uniref:hypothetical protein n=1 Tax=Bacillus arachidis TaxID=2819290 RepID=UPI001FB847C3|nr:hypothetical protein [Bacillus arachidis]